MASMYQENPSMLLLSPCTRGAQKGLHVRLGVALRMHLWLDKGCSASAASAACLLFPEWAQVQASRRPKLDTHPVASHLFTCNLAREVMPPQNGFWAQVSFCGDGDKWFRLRVVSGAPWSFTRTRFPARGRTVIAHDYLLPGAKGTLELVTGAVRWS